MAVPWGPGFGFFYLFSEQVFVCPARAEAAGAQREEIKESRASSIARDGEPFWTGVRMGLLLTGGTFLEL